MKTIIAGSRGVIDVRFITKAVFDSQFEITEVVSGTARGVDQLGEKWASFVSIPVKRFPANWDLHGKSAGYKRNEEMAEYADALIAIWDGESRGTLHMINIANSKGLKVFVFNTKNRKSIEAME
jgi:hypothetical protein